MDFGVPDKLNDVLGEVRRFVEAQIVPLEPVFLSSGFNAALPQLQQARTNVKALGWWLPQIPTEHGGMGLNLMEYGLLSAELGRSMLGHFCFNCQAPDAGNMEILLRFSTDDQREKFLLPLLAGETRSCFAMTEPEHAGSNPVWMSTSAVKDGDNYVINGHKWYTSAADGAGFAIVMAVTNPNAEPHSRASMIIVPADTPGYRIVRKIPVMGDSGEGWASHAEVRFEECRIPKSNLLGEEGAGFRIAQDRLGPGRIHHCMRWIGICERSFDLMCRHAATRELSPGRQLGTQEIVQAWIAESRAEIDAARMMVLKTAWDIEQNGAKQARDSISLIKFHVAGVLQRVVDRAIQTLGGLGMSDDMPLAYFYRHERASRIYDGPDEVHKQAVARRIMQNYGLNLRSGTEK